MIKELKVKPGPKYCSWWDKVPQLTDRSSIKFKPGLNLLIGPNGSGKSTIVLTLAKFFHCAQGGFQRVTENSISDSFMEDFKDKKYWDNYIFKADNIKVVHDGSPVSYFAAGSTVGIKYGAFDDDFFEEGLKNLMCKGSSGQTIAIGLNRVTHSFPEIKYMMNKKHVNKTWAGWIERIEKSLEPNIPKTDSPTLLLDEVERSLDIKNHIKLVNMVIPRLLEAKVQIIMATHSPLFLKKKYNANIIELEEGYLEGCNNLLKEFL